VLQTTALVGGRVIDGTANAPLESGTVLIEGGRIARVGPTPRIDIPAHARVIDTRGMTVLPGLMDLHVHLCSFFGHRGTAWPPTADALLALHGARHAELAIRAGFTTVRDAFNHHGANACLSLRDATRTGLTLGPRILAAGFAGITGTQTDMRIPPLVKRPYGYSADGPWALRTRVRECMRDGYDWIKTFTSGGRSPGEQEEDVFYTNHTREEMQAIADETHVFGARLAVHATTRAAIELAVVAGADTIEHGWPLDDELIELMIQKGTYLVPTISVYSERGFLRKDEVDEHLYNRASRQVESRMRSFERAYRAGVKIANGSDIAPIFPTMPFGQNAFELVYMVRNGMSSIDAIHAATRVAAEALGIDADVGTLQDGKRADVLVVRGDPVQRIETLEDGVALVFKEGACVVDNNEREGR
jgi:imidazolonepropionase-like amidohydrolase